MIFPEYIYWILCGVLLLLCVLSHASTIIYRLKKRFKYNDTYVRIICFHLNHTMSSDWVPVDALDENSKIITYMKKTYLYKSERLIRLPPSFGIYTREPCLFLTENNPDPLDMVHILKQLTAKKGSDELYAAVDSKVFIDLMRGVPKEKTMQIIMIMCVVGAIIYFGMEMFKGGGQ